MYTITLYLYEDTVEGYIGSGILLPTIPAPGTIIIYEGAWRVSDKIQITPAMPGSLSAQQGSPIMVSIMVTSAEGIFR